MTERPDIITELRTLGTPLAERAIAEIQDLRVSVIAFGAQWAVEYAQEHGLPHNHLFPQHYDILARAGGRMVDFTRAAAAPEKD